jgi:arylsulfatase A-like enzyme
MKNASCIGWIGQVILLAGSFLVSVAVDAKAAPADRPPIVLIVADNLGYGDVGCYGNREIKTPNLDRLARQGVRATDCYVASPTCTCSRASLLTGRYPERNGLVNQLSVEGNLGPGLRHNELLIPYFLKPQGYATACFGKWNIGFDPGGRPTERGFDEFFGHASGNMDYYTHVYNGRNDLFHGTEPAVVEGYSTDLFADAACRFIARNAQEPFFVYLPFNAPHYPNPRNKAPSVPCIWQAPDEAFAAYGYSPDETDPKRRYQAVVTALDSGIGRVLAQIDSAGLAEKTLVIFFSDNGAFMLKDRGLEVASNRPLRSGGVTLFEGGIRVPAIVRWPGRIPPGSVCREPILQMDFFNMALEAAGAPLPDDRVIDGRDPTATLAGEAPSPHDGLFFQFRNYSACRKGRYKIVRTAPQQPFALYDLGDDLGETEDLAGEKPEAAASLAGRFDAWLAEVRADPLHQSAVALFDGKTFTGWEGNLKEFRIQDGAVVGGSLQRPVPKNEYLCTTKQYADFELCLKVKILGESVNAGIQIRSHRVPGSNEMIGYQADAEQAQFVKPDGWNDYRIQCQGRRVRFWVNGRPTVDYTEPDTSIPQVGLIGLQIHQGLPSEAWYKEITITELPETF